MIVRGGTHTAAGGSNRMCNSVDRGLAIRFGPRGESGSVFRSSHTERAGSIRPPFISLSFSPSRSLARLSIVRLTPI